jgi:hypothetical protein
MIAEAECQNLILSLQDQERPPAELWTVIHEDDMADIDAVPASR